jgi:hypothetical protein
LKKDILSGKLKVKKSDIQQLSHQAHIPEKSISSLQEVSTLLHEPSSKSSTLEETSQIKIPYRA